jgi:hypothetical protein
VEVETVSGILSRGPDKISQAKIAMFTGGITGSTYVLVGLKGYLFQRRARERSILEICTGILNNYIKGKVWEG